MIPTITSYHSYSIDLTKKESLCINLVTKKAKKKNHDGKDRSICKLFCKFNKTSVL